VLPDVDGLVFCATLRRRWHMPIILLSGTQRQRDRVLGLTLGADDFVPKPFDLNELLARIDAMLRRAAMSGALASEQPRATSDAQTLGSFTIDRARRLASVASRALELTPTEFQILSLMSTRPGEVFTRQELASALWDRVDVSKSRAIDVHIRRLRQKLQVPEAPVIETVWGYGYKLEVADQLRSA
jgi:DNA-binding response OmpR family regulator